MAHTVNINLPAAVPATDLRNNPAFRDGLKNIQHVKGSQDTLKVNGFGFNAAYVTDGDRNVVLRITDQNGRVVMQIPSEEYLIMVKLMKENVQNILLKKA